MNYSFVYRQLSAVCFMIGGFMFVALPWALPALGGVWEHELRGVFGLVVSIGVCLSVAALFWRLGCVCEEQNQPKQPARESDDSRRWEKELFQAEIQTFSKKEATAVVGLSWVLATVLGALPYLLADVHRAEGVPMSICDALFESQSGFSTTGATVFGEVERPDLLPRCILFWRLTTHFLGGLGIMVLFVVLLGYGTGAKTLVRSEMTGPSKSSPKQRIRQLGLAVFGIYVALIAVETVLLLAQGVTLFDSLCHSFSTVSTGGLSSFNASAGHFAAHGYAHAASIEWTLTAFMFLGGSNFILLYLFFKRQPGKLLRDTEWRVYVGMIVATTLIIFVSGLIDKDFDNFGTDDLPTYSQNGTELSTETEQVTVPVLMAFRTVVFQVVSILTTTGLCTDEYEKWTGLSCGVLLLLMFLGGCAGSTSGGFKIIRVICLVKSLPHAVEQSYRPNVVRPLLIGGVPLDKETVRHMMMHFVVLTTVFIGGVLLALLFEPLSTWGNRPVAGDRKLIDMASAVASCLNNVGPGLGLIGARQNFGVFSETSKFLFTWLMMIGRLELFVVLSMFHPGFWQK